MLQMVITFLVLALVAGFFGFNNVEGMSFDIARILFFIFLVLFALSFIANVFRGKRPPMD